MNQNEISALFSNLGIVVQTHTHKCTQYRLTTDKQVILTCVQEMVWGTILFQYICYKYKLKFLLTNKLATIYKQQ